MLPYKEKETSNEVSFYVILSLSKDFKASLLYNPSASFLGTSLCTKEAKNNILLRRGRACSSRKTGRRWRRPLQMTNEINDSLPLCLEGKVAPQVTDEV